VVKIFRRLEDAQKEHRLLLACLEAEISVPTPLRLSGRQLFMTFVPGENLCDYLNAEIDFRQAEPLASWLYRFHTSLKMNRGDGHLRNFLLYGKTIVGLDFEEARPANPLDDLIELCCSIIDTHPMFTPQKYRFCEQFLEHYEGLSAHSINRSLFWGEVARLLKRKMAYRPAQAEILLAEAQRLLGSKGNPLPPEE